MRGIFDDALVENWQEVCAGLDLPDNDDRHVLGAAIAGSAQSIVTFNLKHFPATYLEAHGVETRHPDEFLLDQLDLHPGLALQILRDQAADLVNPQLISSDFSIDWRYAQYLVLPTKSGLCCSQPSRP